MSITTKFNTTNKKKQKRNEKEIQSDLNILDFELSFQSEAVASQKLLQKMKNKSTNDDKLAQQLKEFEIPTQNVFLFYLFIFFLKFKQNTQNRKLSHT